MKRVLIAASFLFLAACSATPQKICSSAVIPLSCERNEGSSPRPATERPAPSKPTKPDAPKPDKPSDPKGPSKGGHGPKNPSKDHHGGPKGKK